MPNSERILVGGGPSTLFDVRVKGRETETYPPVLLTQAEQDFAGQLFLELESKVTSFSDFKDFPKILIEQFLKEYTEKEEVITKIFLRELGLIDFKSLLYPGTKESLLKATEIYGPKLKSVHLWSQGDVDATGHQTNKIFRTGLGAILKSSRAASLKDKLFWNIRTDKFANIEGMLDSVAEGQKEKVVVIEDSVENIKKVTNMLKDRATVFPIWANYSRRGASLRKNNLEEFERLKKEYNGIDSLAEISSREKEFGEVFKDAHLFLDFDGVLANNEELRRVNGEALLKAFIIGLGAGNQERQKLVEEIRTKLNLISPEKN